MAIPNNNPANLKQSSDIWQGEVNHNGDINTLVEFDGLQDGVRAAIINAYNSINSQQFNLSDYIENYVAVGHWQDELNNVMAFTGWPADFDLYANMSQGMIMSLLNAQFRAENALELQDLADIAECFSDAMSDSGIAELQDGPGVTVGEAVKVFVEQEINKEISDNSIWIIAIVLLLLFLFRRSLGRMFKSLFGF